MKVGLYNLEPKYLNIALEKIRMFHQENGDTVIDYLPLYHDNFDRIYCSSIFDYSDRSYVSDDMLIGGSGFSTIIKLSPEIERMKPKINAGFTTRGCCRKCEFCIVPQMEGSTVEIGDIYDFWDGVSRRITIMDNNILGAREHFFKIVKQIKDENLLVNFSQGFDIKLIDKEVMEHICSIKFFQKLHFAFDNIKDKDIIIKRIKLLLRYKKPSRLMFFLLCGYDSNPEDDIERVRILKTFGIDPFIMRYHQESKILNEYSRYINRFFFRKISFEEFLKIRNMKYLLEDKNNGYR